MMPNEEELNMMPVWQNHESRITTLENTFAGFSHKIDSVDKKMEGMELGFDKKWESVESKLDKNNDEQKELLNTLISHHLETNKMRISNFWQVILNITGAGGVLIALIYAAVQIFQFLTS